MSKAGSRSAYLVALGGLLLTLPGCGVGSPGPGPRQDSSPPRLGSFLPKEASGVPLQDGQFALSVTLEVGQGGGIELSFLETLKGDFNPDGRVDFADVNLLVASFGQGAGESDQAAKVDIHGVEDGSVNFADVNLLVSNFGLEVDSYLVYRLDPGGDAYQVVGTADGPVPEQNRRRFTFTDSSGQQDSFYALQPQDSSQVRGVAKGPYSACPTCQPPDVELPLPSGQSPVDILLAPGEVADVDLAAGEARTITLDGGGGDARYLLIFFALEEIPVGEPSYEQPDNAGHFQLTLSAQAAGGSSASLASLGLFPARPRPIRLVPPMESEVDQRLITCGYQGELGRKLMEMERVNAELLRREIERGVVSPKRTSQAPPASRSFNIVFSDSDPSDLDKTVTSDLVAQSSDGKVVFYLDRQHTEALPQNKLDEWVELTASLIIPREAELFGQLRNPDGSGRFTVLFTPEINRMAGSVQGLFVTNDQVSSSPGSNFMDIVYLAVPDPSGGPYDPDFPMSMENWQEQVPSVIAHEMQHLLNYSNRLRRMEASGDPLVQEQSWLNEAVSHFAEDIVGLRNRSLYSMAKRYLNLAPAQPLFSGADSVVRRGGGYLLIRYLFDRQGKQAINQLVGKDPSQPALAGLDNLARAWGGNVEDLLSAAAVSQQVSGGPSAGLFDPSFDTYHRALDDGSLFGDAGTGNFIGMEMRSVEEINGQLFVVAPPTYLPVDQTPASYLVPVNGVAYFLVDGVGGSVVELSVDVGSDGQARELPVYLRIARLMDGGPEALVRIDQGSLPGSLELRVPVVGTFTGGATSHDFTLSIPSDNTMADLRWINLNPQAGDLVIELQGTPRESFLADNPFGIGLSSTLFLGAGEYNISIRDPAAAGLSYLFVVNSY